MILQPLVENAVKHGIGSRLDGGAVRIAAERAGSLLRIRVENDADEEEEAAAPAGCGIGLDNVRRRLAAAFAHEAGIHWTREPQRFRVDLTLPASCLPAPAPAPAPAN
jgi:LytS/YehU family sensor histidine kinase